LQIDARELLRDKPSYTYDTLLQLRAELGDAISLILCMGADAFVGLPTWYRWQELIQLAHIVVITRPGWTLPESGDAQSLLNKHQGDVESLSRASAGSILLQNLRLLPVSATDIRAQIQAGHSAQFLVPDSVWKYILVNELYR
jgi:nicotinate-nucleotide adenylyltransferase